MQKKKPLRTSLTLAGLSLPALAAAQEFEAFRDIMPSGDGGIWIRAGEELSYVPAGQYILQTDGSALVSTSVLDFSLMATHRFSSLLPFMLLGVGWVKSSRQSQFFAGLKKINCSLCSMFLEQVEQVVTIQKCKRFV